MSNYRRAYVPGGTYFFTLVTWDRCPLFRSEERIAQLREAMRHIKRQQPFTIEAAVVLPDHLHCIMTLPSGDADFPGRWREIKKRFSKHVDTRTNHRGERLVWQRRFYEHVIRDERDWRIHVDYIHYNPVKHGLARCAKDWPWSSFRRSARLGWCTEDWGCGPLEVDLGGDVE